MSDEQVRIRATVAVAACAALAALGASLVSAPTPDAGKLIIAATLAAMTGLCRVFPLHVAPRRKMSMDSAPMFAAALLLSPWLAAASVAVAIVSAETILFVRLQRQGDRRPLRVEQVIFNGAQASLAVCAGSWVFRAIHSGALDGWETSALVAAPPAILGMFAVNEAVLLAIVVAQVGRRILKTWFHDRGDILYDAALYASGYVIALASGIHPLMLPLLAFPVAVFHRAMSDHVALRVQTREAIIAMADVIDARDHYTFEHSKRVGDYARQICEEMQLSPDLIEDIALAARVHDIGKICIRDDVLLKPAGLDDAEYLHMREHPDIGAKLMLPLKEFGRGTTYIRHHHERWDGKGYPLGLSGRAIPLGARIVSVADTFDAITTTRVYREGLPEDWARMEMARVAGTQLDAEVVKAFFRCRSWDWPEESAIQQLNAARKEHVA